MERTEEKKIQKRKTIINAIPLHFGLSHYKTGTVYLVVGVFSVFSSFSFYSSSLLSVVGNVYQRAENRNPNHPMDAFFQCLLFDLLDNFH